ncbi:MAG: pyridoxamine 5'-phosphate oxidase family protein [Bacteroidia bacterium]
MTGILSTQDIQALLENHYTGHIACADENGPYVVPFTYYYDAETHTLLSYTAEGRKVEALRKDPRVSINIVDINALNDWQSVVIQGQFEELEGVEAMNAIKLLITRLKTQINQIGKDKVDAIADMSPAKETANKVVYRIAIKEISGRFEKASPKSELLA